MDLADGDNTLHSKLKRRNDYTGEADYSSYSDELDEMNEEAAEAAALAELLLNQEHHLNIEKQWRNQT